MIILKSKIAQVIKKERDRERNQCEKKHKLEMKKFQSETETKHSEEIKKLHQMYKKELKERDVEIRKLHNEIEKNYDLYKKLRLREKQLDTLSTELEDEINAMVVKMHESFQPFYRSMNKLEVVKRRSDNRHSNVDKKIRVVK